MVEFITGPLLDQNTDESGVVHTAMPNTDYTNANVERPGYALEHIPLTRGLVGWWPLAWDSGRDLSGNDNHGTLNGGPTTGVAGRGGLEATGFDGADDHILLPSNVNIDSAYTLSAWVRPRTIPTSGDPEDRVWTYEDGYSTNVRILNGNEIEVQHNGGSSWTRIAYSGISEHEWVHVASVWDGSTLYFYVNGSLVNSESVSAIDSRSNTNDVGRRGGSFNDLNLDGVVFDHRAYSRALSDSEIQTLYEFGSADVARDPTDGVARYALDGDATDSFGSNDGTTNGGLTYSSDAIRGQSGDFDGADDYVDTTVTSVSSERAVSAWVKTDDLNNNRRAVSKDNGGSSGDFVIRIRNDGSLDYVEHSSGNASVLSYNGVAVGEWYHVCGVATASEQLLYINGELLDSTAISGADTGSLSVSIGAESSGSNRFWDGNIDDVRIYDRALSPSEVFELYLWGTFGIDMTQHTVKA